MKTDMKRQILRDCRRTMGPAITAMFFHRLVNLAAPTLAAWLIGDMANYLLRLDKMAILSALPRFSLGRFLSGGRDFPPGTGHEPAADPGRLPLRFPPDGQIYPSAPSLRPHRRRGKRAGTDGGRLHRLFLPESAHSAGLSRGVSALCRRAGGVAPGPSRRVSGGPFWPCPLCRCCAQPS